MTDNLPSLFHHTDSCLVTENGHPGHLPRAGGRLPGFDLCDDVEWISDHEFGDRG